MEVSWNRGTPKSSILIRISVINHPFRGTPLYGNHQYVEMSKISKTGLAIFVGQGGCHSVRYTSEKPRRMDSETWPMINHWWVWYILFNDIWYYVYIYTEISYNYTYIHICTYTNNVYTYIYIYRQMIHIYIYIYTQIIYIYTNNIFIHK